ncbi:response regulator transcription factor [Altererythrobacter aquiaggeris]|uniref:response regulator transcription factor n=1 Tax=Aestuarierythrobacter aquiaggeris TaxID=1898396 RepID=UPI0030163A92
MQVVNILTTSAVGESNLDFVHDDKKFTFDRIRGDAPIRLTDGPVWAFVDWLMPDLSGLEMCRRLRADPRTADAHVTMVLERDDVQDRRRALSAGADDYMVGPVDRTAVLDRVMALLATSRRHSLKQLVVGPLVIDMEALIARWDGVPIALQPGGFRLLRFLAENPNRLLSRQDVIEAISSKEQKIDERSVDVWIGRLRKALKKAGAGNPVRTVRWHGYVFDAPNA